MAEESFRERNRLRRARNAFEHLRAFARRQDMADPDAAAKEAVQRAYSVGLEGGVDSGAAGSRRAKPSRPAAGGTGSGGRSRAAGRSSTTRGKSGGTPADGSVPRRLDDRTKEQLYARAQELGIEGRSSMSKEELIAAIREKQ